MGSYVITFSVYKYAIDQGRSWACFSPPSVLVSKDLNSSDFSAEKRDLASKEGVQNISLSRQGPGSSARSIVQWSLAIDGTT